MKCGNHKPLNWRLLRAGSAIVVAASICMPVAAQIEELNAPLVYAPNPKSASLNDIIISAYEHHPQLRSFRSRLKGTREVLVEAKAASLPQIALTGGANISDRDALLQNGTTFDQYTEPKSLSLRLNQTLYTGGRRKLLRQGAVLNVQSEEARYEALSTNIAAEIITDYMSLLSAQQELEILNESVTGLVKLEEVVTARKNAGDATRTDLAQAVSRLASSRARRTSAQAELALARDRLLSKTGFLVENPNLPEQAEIELSMAYEDIIELARRRSPAIQASQFDEKSALINVKSEQRKFLPTVTLQAAAVTVRESSPTIARDDDLTVGINFTLPLYSGGSGSAQTRRALANYNSARYNTENIIRESDLQINQLWSRLKSGEAVIAAQQASVDANAEALEGISRGEAVGLASIEDILDARENKLQAELALHRAVFQQHTALLLIRLYTGELDVYDYE